MYVEIEAPAVDGYPAGFSQYWVRAFFVGSISQDYQINALASTYVRVVESALIEYRLGVERLREFWSTHDSFKLSAAHSAITHFETCISNMYRATNCFRRISRHKAKDALSIELNKERPAFATDTVARRFMLARHEVHHMDEAVTKGRLREGQQFVLGPTGPEVAHPTEPNQTVKTIDRIAIGSHEIHFSELAGWLTEMKSVADKIASFEPKRTVQRDA
jgi:hypothetical protein